MTLSLWLSNCASIQELPSNRGADSLLLIALEKDFEEGIYRYGFRYEIYIQELKNIDFFLQIFGEVSDEYKNELLKKLKNIDIITGAFIIDTDSLKSKKRLIY